jgi:hypothetical protein
MLQLSIKYTNIIHSKAQKMPKLRFWVCNYLATLHWADGRTHVCQEIARTTKFRNATAPTKVLEVGVSRKQVLQLCIKFY